MIRSLSVMLLLNENIFWRTFMAGKPVPLRSWGRKQMVGGDLIRVCTTKYKLHSEPTIHA
jgi:hypothetical protein